MATNDTGISVENLSKIYRIGLREQRHDRLLHAAWDFFRSPVKNFKKYRSLYRFDDLNEGGDDSSAEASRDTIWALKRISFDVKRGEALGIIGRNGAGKSTLLKVLSRIVEPTEGYAKIRGRVSSLLEVGTGFHQELTGRENVYLNGTILGMKKDEVKRKFDEIVAFSEIGKFIDTPVKRYSSGMKVRLAFSVAAHLEPEILIIDEVLAVGDVNFQAKCLGKMDETGKQGRTILFVSHNISAVTRLCDRALWIDHGTIKRDGASTDVANEYLSTSMLSVSSWRNPANHELGEEVEFRAVKIVGNEGRAVDFVNYDSSFLIEIQYELFQPLRSFSVICQLTNASGEAVWTSWDTDSSGWMSRVREEGAYCSTCKVPGKILGPGRYYVSLGSCTSGKRFAYHERVISFVVSEIGYTLNPGRQGAIKPILEWDVTVVDPMPQVHRFP